MRILVIDTGVGAGHALDLVDSQVTVDYYIPWFSAFPDEKSHLLLSGLANRPLFPGDNYDVVVVADVGYHSFQMPACPVVGYSVDLYRLEVDRVLAKQVFSELGIPTADYVVLSDDRSSEDLMRLASEHSELVIKTNWRGNFETKILDSGKALAYIESMKNQICMANPVTVEAKIEGVEIGFDLLVSEQGMLDRCFYGYASYAHCVRAAEISLLPSWIRGYLQALGGLAHASGFRGMFSAEFMVSEDGVYILEVAARFPYITSLIYSYYYGFYDILRAIVDGFQLPDLDRWMVGIPVFSRDRFGEVVFDEVQDYKMSTGKYQLILSQIYRLGDRYKILEWPTQRVGVVYGSDSNLKELLEDMVSEIYERGLVAEIGVKDILEAEGFFKTRI